MKKKIETLEPETFRRLFMFEKDNFHPDKNIFNNFYIQNISKKLYSLKLPLPLHRKTVNDFILLTKGSMTRTINLDTYEMKEGSLFFLPQGNITTTTVVSSDIDGFYCHFSNNFFANIHLINDELYTPPIINIDKPTMLVLSSLLARMEHIYNTSMNSNLIKAYLAAFLLEIQMSNKMKVSNKLKASEKIARQFKRLLSSDTNIKKNVNDYAALLNVTPNHLNKCVKTTYGRSTSEMIGQMSMLQAKLLLHEKQLTISETAFELGYEDPGYFSRVFKEHTGFAPSEYLKLIDFSR